MSHGKQFTLYTHDKGPNGWKVAIVLEELGLTYEPIYLDFQKGEHKAPEFTKYNPNGRIPAIIDHKNNDLVLWESNAIITYLVDNYDPEHKISASSAEDKYKQLQWLFFQASGQGPYFGQAVWFTVYHPEKVQSAQERYQNEVIRVLGVLESVLSKQEWLVGGKPTVADFSFYTWNAIATSPLMGETDNVKFNFEKDCPHVFAWNAKIAARDSVKKILADREALQKH